MLWIVLLITVMLLPQLVAWRRGWAASAMLMLAGISWAAATLLTMTRPFTLPPTDLPPPYHDTNYVTANGYYIAGVLISVLVVAALTLAAERASRPPPRLIMRLLAATYALAQGVTVIAAAATRPALIDAAAARPVTAMIAQSVATVLSSFILIAMIGIALVVLARAAWPGDGLDV